MASSKAKAKTNVVETFSRFSALGIESEEEREEEERSVHKLSNAEKNAKKRARKKKKANADNSAKNELRNLAFSKPISAAAIQSIHKQNHPIPVENDRKLPHEHVSVPRNPNNVATESVEHFDSNYKDPQSWEEWKNQDESYVADQFQRDLQAALRISAAEDINHVQKNTQSKNSKKKPAKKAMSLQEFTQLPTETTDQPLSHRKKKPVLNGYAPEQIDPSHFEFECPAELNLHVESSASENKKSKKKKKKATENKNTLSEVFEELNSTRNTSASHSNTIIQEQLDPIRLAALRNDIEEKDKEIQKLKLENGDLMKELFQVKKRNNQLCCILGQGEMEEKSKLLIQVEEMNTVKNEISAELEKMHSTLEQERTKVSILKQELLKYQGSRSHSKSVSDPS